MKTTLATQLGIVALFTLVSGLAHADEHTTTETKTMDTTTRTTTPSGMNTQAMTETPGAAQAGTEGLTDAKIAEILMTANRAEIDAAQVASTHATNAEVKQFAHHMIAEHTKNVAEGKQVTKKAAISPQKNAMAMTLAKESKAETSALRKSKGAEFDKAYMNQQVSMHQTLLKDLNEKFIPTVQNPELKAFLEATKVHVAEHLTRAQSIQSALR